MLFNFFILFSYTYKGIISNLKLHQHHHHHIRRSRQPIRRYTYIIIDVLYIHKYFFLLIIFSLYLITPRLPKRCDI